MSAEVVGECVIFKSLLMSTRSAREPIAIIYFMMVCEANA